jgi:fumarylacetoacetase
VSRTHDPAAKSWIETPPESDFPIQNLPFGIIATDTQQRMATRVGDTVVDLVALADHGLINPDLITFGNVLDFVPLGTLPELRERLFELFEAENPRLRDDERVRAQVLQPVSAVRMMRPFSVGAFVDFYSSEHHASNVGKMFRPQGDPLLPNWKHLPVGYNGRASTVLPSGIPIVRPCGQSKPPDAETPVFGPSKALDFELEMGFFLGAESPFWRPIPADEADQFIFGLVLVNDWSARDIQAWEYQPLGPFLSKSFATSISDWVVTLEALEPWACDGPPQDPEPLAYLRTNQKWHYDIQLEVAIQTKRMTRPQTICRSNARHLYWSIAQQLAHQTINGTHVSEGDLYASGTISGPTPESRGCMLELTWRGQDPIVLHETGETRSWIEDGDTVIMRGWCDGTGYRIGFGELRTKVFGTLEALAEAYR